CRPAARGPRPRSQRGRAAPRTDAPRRHPGPPRRRVEARARDRLASRDPAPADALGRARRRSAGRLLTYNKLCDLPDFARPELTPYLRELYPTEASDPGPNPMAGREDRKPWEVAMAARTLVDFGAATREVLGVGAGTERTVFWL